MRFLLITLLALMNFACSAIRESVDTKLLTITPKVISLPAVADLQIKDKREFAQLSDMKSPQQNIDIFIQNTKKKALHELQIKCQADVLVETRYEVKLDMSNKLMVKVSAYPAFYKNFRAITEDNYKLIKDILELEQPKLESKRIIKVK